MGAAVEESKWTEVEATVTGYRSVLIITENKSSQSRLLHRLKFFQEGTAREERQARRRRISPKGAGVYGATASGGFIPASISGTESPKPGRESQ